MFSLATLGISCASGMRAFVVGTPGDACARHNRYQDSVALVRERLRSSDSVLRRYDLSQAADPLFRLKRLKALKAGTDSAHAVTIPTVERRVVALRAQGADASDIDMYLGMYEMLDANPVGFTADSANRQVAAIHKLETDSLYMAYIKETTTGSEPDSGYYANDTLRLNRLMKETSSLCSHYYFELPFDLAVWLVSVFALFIAWWWWFGGRQT